jgi:hypothetical protein
MCVCVHAGVGIYAYMYKRMDTHIHIVSILSNTSCAVTYQPYSEAHGVHACAHTLGFTSLDSHST